MGIGSVLSGQNRTEDTSALKRYPFPPYIDDDFISKLPWKNAFCCVCCLLSIIRINKKLIYISPAPQQDLRYPNVIFCCMCRTSVSFFCVTLCDAAQCLRHAKPRERPRKCTPKFFKNTLKRQKLCSCQVAISFPPPRKYQLIAALRCVINFVNRYSWYNSIYQYSTTSVECFSEPGC